MIERQPFVRHYPRKAEIARAIEAAKACGLDVGGVEVSPDGSIRIIDKAATPRSMSDFDRYEEQL